ncbi:MAG: GTPase Era [Candidatus Lernaella stagnicola]|nr:GTPase Era [Candidatus Lernaella stagnicola]
MKTASQPPAGFKSGYAMLLGRPNVGKSTILNAVMGEELAIVTPKPQTTRNRILGISTADEYQIIFLDTPGVIEDDRGLNLFLKREIQRAMSDADVILLVVEATGPPKLTEKTLIERLRTMARPVVLAINKIDRAKREDLLPLIEQYMQIHDFAAIVPICATRADGIGRLVEEVVKALPEGPMYYPPDQLTSATERFLVAEMIREQVFLQTKQEIPYSSAVLVEAYEQQVDLLRIHAKIFIEREGQKGILIGHGGEKMKSIGSAARRKIEAFASKRVFLDLRVVVKKDWTRSESMLREMGYTS